MKLQTLPYIDFQPDAPSVFDDVSQSVVEQEDIWVSCYRLGESSVHGKARLSRKGKGSEVDIESRDGVQVERASHTAFRVSAPALQIEGAAVRFPKQVIHPVYTKTASSAPLNINTLDVSPDGTQLVYGGPDGYARVQNVRDGTTLPLKGHVGDVLTTRWFPSGKVVLTGSSDTTLRISSSETGDNPRTLTGHKRAVTSAAIVGVGRTVVSGAKDGSVRVWDVGAGKGVGTMYTEGYSGVEAITLGDEVGGEEGGGNRLVYAATSGGAVTAFDMGNQTTVHVFRHLPDGQVDGGPAGARHGPVHAIASRGHHLATGNSKGVVVLRDTRMLGTTSEAGPGDSSSSTTRGIFAAFRRTEAGINGLSFARGEAGACGPELLIASASGLPCRVALAELSSESRVRIVEEYAGWEPVPVEACAVAPDGSAWFAGGEGGIRRY